MRHMSHADSPDEADTRRLTRVSLDRHGGRFWRRFTSWDFVRAHRLVPIVLGEHEQVAASLPIFFVKTGSGLWPMALTRLTERGACALISPGGRWRGSYVPSILRVHPFAARPAEAGDPVLLVDEASGLVTEDPSDEAFFAAGGAPSPALSQVDGFFRERAAAEGRTRAAMSQIVARAGLVPFTPPEGYARMEVQGLFVPDRARIEGLGRADLGALHRSGALALLQVQAVSLHHLPVLAAVEARPEDPAAQPPAMPVGPDAAGRDAVPSDFLDALARSRDHEAGRGMMDACKKSDDVNNPYTVTR